MLTKVLNFLQGKPNLIGNQAYSPTNDQYHLALEWANEHNLTIQSMGAQDLTDGGYVFYAEVSPKLENWELSDLQDYTLYYDKNSVLINAICGN